MNGKIFLTAFQQAFSQKCGGIFTFRTKPLINIWHTSKDADIHSWLFDVEFLVKVKLLTSRFSVCCRILFWSTTAKTAHYTTMPFQSSWISDRWGRKSEKLCALILITSNEGHENATERQHGSVPAIWLLQSTLLRGAPLFPTRQKPRNLLWMVKFTLFY